MSKIQTVGLDGGHGGRDAGAVGNGIKEKDMTLAIALATEKYLLANYSNIRVVQTRRTDTYLTLKQRTDIVNKAKVDFFVSIHINSASNPQATGYETFISTGGISSATTTRAHNVLANYFTNVLKVRNRGLKKMNFYVIANSNMPAILTESLFINNPNDAKLLKNNIEGIAKAHAEAIAAALNLKRKSPIVTLPSQDTEEEDFMKKLSPTAQKDMVILLQHAYDTKIFSVNHVSKVKDMTIEEAFDLLVSYNARTIK